MLDKDLKIINESTGEILDNGKYKIVDISEKIILSRKKKNNEETLALTKETILNDPTLSDKIYSLMKRQKEINGFGFMKMSGVYVNNELFKIGMDSGFAKEINTLIVLTSNRNMIKKSNEVNCNQECNTWTDLYNALGITNKNKASKFKKILEKYDLVRQVTSKNSRLKIKKHMILNPNYFRYGTHISQTCIVAFRDVTLSKIHKYNTYYLYLNGMLDYDEIS